MSRRPEFWNVQGGGRYITERDADAEANTAHRRRAGNRRWIERMTVEDGCALRYADGCVVGIKESEEAALAWLGWLVEHNDPDRYVGAYMTPARAEVSGGRVHVYALDNDTELPGPFVGGCEDH